MRAVGYRQVWDFLDGGEQSAAAHARLREAGIVATRQLAKRQMTWLRAMDQAEIFDCLRDDLRVAVAQRLEKFFQSP
jgi:tRNA dimethylallyltransferase